MEYKDKTPLDIKLYSVKEVASLLSISKDKVYELIYSKQLPAIKIGSYKIRHKTLVEFLRNMEGQLIDITITNTSDYHLRMIA